METNATSDVRSFYYDGAGRLARRVDRNSEIRQFSYDDLDRNTAEKWYSDGVPVPQISITTTTEGGLTNEVQRVGFSDSMWMLSGGTFTLSFSGHTTAAIAYNASAATVQTALEGLSSIGSGNAAVVKTVDTTGQQEWTVTFIGGLAGTDVVQTTIDSSGVSGMITDTQATDTQGGIANDEEQVITLTNADGGTMRLAFKGQTTAELAHDATAAQVETALEELPAIDQVSISGAAGGPWTVTFTGAHTGTDQPQLNADAAALTSGTDVLELEGTMRRLALTIISPYLTWFNRQEKGWTDSNLLPAFYSSESIDRQAAWAGFLWNPQVDKDSFARIKPGLLELATKQGKFKRGHLQSLAGLVLIGWLPTTGGDKGQQITSEELHGALLAGGPEFRTQILWQLQRELASSSNNRDFILSSVVTLLTDVWPRELEVRSPDVSASFLDLLLVDEVVFGRLVTAVLPLLVTLTQKQRYHFHFQEEAIKPVINSHPEQFLAMLCKILPEEPELWPYGFGSTLGLLLSANPDLKNDRRFESLQQCWNRRW